MNTRVEYINILQRFKQEHAGEYGITSIGLFGSVARNEQTEESDVDVVVEAPVMSIFTCMDIKKQLEEIRWVVKNVLLVFY